MPWPFRSDFCRSSCKTSSVRSWSRRDPDREGVTRSDGHPNRSPSARLSNPSRDRSMPVNVRCAADHATGTMSARSTRSGPQRAEPCGNVCSRQPSPKWRPRTKRWPSERLPFRRTLTAARYGPTPDADRNDGEPGVHHVTEPARRPRPCSSSMGLRRPYFRVGHRGGTLPAAIRRPRQRACRHGLRRRRHEPRRHRGRRLSPGRSARNRPFPRDRNGRSRPANSESRGSYRARAPHGVDIQPVENPRDGHGLGSVASLEERGPAYRVRRTPARPAGRLVMAEHLLASAHGDLLQADFPGPRGLLRVLK